MPDDSNGLAGLMRLLATVHGQIWLTHQVQLMNIIITLKYQTAMLITCQTL
jgi:hypothetical protein